MKTKGLLFVISLIFVVIVGIVGSNMNSISSTIVPTPIDIENIVNTLVATPDLPGYTFTPPSRTVTVPPDATGVDFIGKQTEIRPTSTEVYTFPASCIPISTKIENATVTKIIDGDTIKVDIEGKVFSVRYIGIDAPEIGTLGADKATAYNSKLVSGKSIILVKDKSETDKYDRLLRYVIVDNIFVNYELVKNGYATAWKYPPDISCADYLSGVSTTPILIPTLMPTNISPSDAVCDCNSDKYNCSNFNTHAEAQSCFNYCNSLGMGDIHKLDRDKDGNACETLP